jgi:hypothetical protein
MAQQAVEAGLVALSVGMLLALRQRAPLAAGKRNMS